ncbi:Aste57867_143 [Aphanomyces stellatus]|uniref:Aste57867_143 protein n=1 Tax=Aphanomyces stellatus TaxID=120398 RepID=A0A485K336_9STRA|nr:hypothetical protein As57867_000143 [Aphanomyces stellatus]VFT77369.1 Aste57867_143 [Aphanomyces stellatus]
MIHETNMQCKYAYKECFNHRTYKRDGELHRLCEHHRNKANALQKIYATKRRSELRAQKRQLMHDKIAKIEVEPLPFVPHDIKVEDFPIDDFQSLFFEDVEPIEVFSDVDELSDEEYAYLSEVF